MSNLEYSNVKPINNLIESFHRLPGIGPKMAQRLTYYLVRMSIKEAETLANVLHGVIAPMKGIGPEDIKLDDLVDRIHQGNVKELVLATNPNVEGDATTAYIQDLVVSLDLKITRLARGLPMGGDLEYADFVTLSRAIEGRQVLG